jgi:tRNA 5-methylaminomethyl-2-thiouridine biosynthesis bifunctional protein
MADDVATLWQPSGVSLRWSERQRFTILAVGNSALATFLTAWAAWRVDPRRCERLDVIAVGACVHNPALPSDANVDPALLSLLSKALPPPTPDLHRLAFEDGRVQLLICPDDVSRAAARHRREGRRLSDRTPPRATTTC